MSFSGWFSDSFYTSDEQMANIYDASEELTVINSQVYLNPSVVVELC